MAETDRLEVALFPIPNVVAFPGTVLPLHVFEPRYRKLIHDCVADHRMVGVSHVRKVIHEPAKNQTLEQTLSSNQATYQSREVFSAGRCEILETTSDGRIIARVMMSQRLLLLEEIQSLPYRIVVCEPLIDVEPSEPMTSSDDLQRLINNRLIAAVASHNPEIARELEQTEWTSLPPDEYSFRIFQFLRFDAEIMQDILEAPSANARLTMIWDVLRRT